MNTNFSTEIIGIKSLNLLFFNYDSAQLEEMLAIRELNHCWVEYLNENEQTYMQLWEFYLSKVSYKTQILLLEIAMKYYGEEAKRSFDNALAVDRMIFSRQDKI